MKRRHLFEFGDQPWLPEFLRDAMTDYLALVYRLSPLPGVWAEVIERILKATGSEEIVDLCSGSGGPMSLVVAELRRRGCHAEVTLTDLHVRQRHGTGGIRYWPQPVSALSVPTGLEGLRTMFAAFHHFAPGEAAGIPQSAVAAHCSIAIFEATSRSVAAIASSIFNPAPGAIVDSGDSSRVVAAIGVHLLRAYSAGADLLGWPCITPPNVYEDGVGMDDVANARRKTTVGL